MKKAIIILTAIPEEQDAVLSFLNEYRTVLHPVTGTTYYEGRRIIQGAEVAIIVGRTNQTNVNAATETERVISLFKPSHIFYIGVAGGLKDVKVGDIVIGEQVVGYERGKVEGEYKSRFQYAASSYDLEQAAFAFSKAETWKTTARSLLNTTFHPEIRTFSGVIASGEKVIASEEAEQYKLIKTNISHALAVEMEGLGFLNTCRSYPEIKYLLVRGISDLINDKGEKDSQGSQYYASKNVATFIFGMIDQLTLPQLQPVVEKSIMEQIFEIACKLYPRGLEDKGIWQRAGGDLSLVILNTQGKGQWTEGLRLIQHGGGGDITFRTLLEQIYQDAPGSEAVENLLKQS